MSKKPIKESDLIKSEPEFGEPDLVEVELSPGGNESPVRLEPSESVSYALSLARYLVFDVGLG